MTTEPLLDFIKSQLQLGVSKAAITTMLIGQEWSPTDINEAFDIIANAPAAKMTTEPSMPQPVSSRGQEVMNSSRNKSQSHLVAICVTILIIVCLGAVGVLAYYTWGMSAASSNHSTPVVATTSDQITEATSTNEIPVLSSTSTTSTASTTSISANPPSAPVQKPAITQSQPGSTVKFTSLITGGSASAKINAGSWIGYNVQINSGSPLMFMIGWSGNGLTVNLTDSQGKTMNLTATASSNTTSGTPNPILITQAGQSTLVYKLQGPIVSGNWKLTANNSSAAPVNFTVTTIGDSNIVIIPQPDLIRLGLGGDLNLSVFISENTSGQAPSTSGDNPYTPLLNMNVQANILDSNQNVVQTVPLSDGVVNGAGTPNDGIYISGPIHNLPSGEYQVSYTVQGTDPQGQTISRKSNLSGEMTSVDVSTGDMQIEKIDDNGIDTVGNGKTSVIQVGFWINAKSALPCDIAATFVTPTGQEIPLSGQFACQVGPQRLPLMLQSSQYGSKMSNGVYKVKDILMFVQVNREDVWVDSWVNGDGTYTTQNYTVN